jgi:hypothetical protein
MTSRRRFLVGVLAAALAACDSPPADAPADVVRERLVGTWLRDYEESGTRVRRILVLEPDGNFRELSLAVSDDATSPRVSRGSGTWLYDGINLKRHYRLVNDRPLSAPTIPFATFELRFSSRFEFVGVDHIHKREVVYQRVADGTLP